MAVKQLMPFSGKHFGFCHSALHALISVLNTLYKNTPSIVNPVRSRTRTWGILFCRVSFFYWPLFISDVERAKGESEAFTFLSRRLWRASPLAGGANIG